MKVSLAPEVQVDSFLFCCYLRGTCMFNLDVSDRCSGTHPRRGFASLRHLFLSKTIASEMFSFVEFWFWLFFFFVTTVLSGKMSFWWNRNCWRNLTNFDNSAWKGAGEEYLESAGAPSYDIFWMERSFDLFLFLFSKWCFKMFCFVGEQNGWIKCLKKKKGNQIFWLIRGRFSTFHFATLLVFWTTWDDLKLLVVVFWYPDSRMCFSVEPMMYEPCLVLWW